MYETHTEGIATTTECDECDAGPGRECYPWCTCGDERRRCVEKPTWSKRCHCGSTVERWRGDDDVACRRCGASYNTFGQRLRDDWYGNPAMRDDDLDDLEGYERQQAAKELWG